MLLQILRSSGQISLKCHTQGTTKFEKLTFMIAYYKTARAGNKQRLNVNNIKIMLDTKDNKII